ncbi:hypothetical protein NQ314_011997 [Rhamnusium bicolor]|uniref:DDE Tnp4 domain-containing protein n=1 Tax=Rhamnusium bicolor TaxID=1586634 RepID=A0AAV8XEW3_9CUCU|nr:hypothetical protein NQ314_011997 [Rhamnusium bicolor]
MSDPSTSSESASSDKEQILQILLNEYEHEVPKNRNYVENTVALYSEQEFISHFRVSRNVYNDLVENFRNSDYFSEEGNGPDSNIGAAHSVLIFLWFAAHQTASFRDVADRFDITISSLVQVVCDHEKRIRDVFLGYPGSVHDSRAFRASPLSTTLAEKCGPINDIFEYEVIENDENIPDIVEPQGVGEDQSDDRDGVIMRDNVAKMLFQRRIFTAINIRPGKHNSIRPGKKPKDPTVTDLRCLRYSPIEKKILYKLNYDDKLEAPPIRSVKYLKDIQYSPLHKERLKIKFKK